VTSKRPNVLVLMSDEQAWATMGCTGNPAARTPHLDALAERSTSFDAGYTPFPLCCPSRASLWTGQMPRHHHVLGNWRAIAPHLADRGLAASFGSAGYHTVYAGKWHVPGTTPARMGFADTVAIPAVLDGKDRGRYIEPYRQYARDQGYDLLPDHIENLTPADLASLRDPSSPLRGTAQIPVEHFLETWQTGQFLTALDRRPDDRPWFAACSFNAPHFPMVVPAPYDRLIDRSLVRLPESLASGPSTKPPEVAESVFARRFADLTDDDWVEIVAHYLGLCALVDAQVGRVMSYLRDSGQLDSTVVVFTSDHGDMMGAHRLMEKGHLLHYEEALRVPLLVSHPDAAPSRTSNLVSMVDIAPTVAELAGVPWLDGGDGISFAGMVGEACSSATRTHVTAESVLYGGASDASGEHVDPRTWDPLTDHMNLSVRTPRYRYIYRSRDADELYDHDADPHEQHDLARDPATRSVRQGLRRLLADEVGDVWPDVARLLDADAEVSAAPAQGGP
jgi:arylsulfatase A-like enzyme